MFRHVLHAFLLLLMLLAARPAAAAENIYIVAHDATWPPLEFVDEKGALIGYSIDYIAAVSKAAGFQIKHINGPWDGIFSRLAEGKYDIVASSVAITDERSKSMDFSTPYFETKQVLVLRADNAAASLAALERPVFGAQIGTTGQSAANEHPNTTAKLFDDLSDAMMELAAGKIDGVVCDMPVAYYYTRMLPAYVKKIKIAPFPISDRKEYYAFAVRKGNEQLLRMINDGIAAVQRDKIAEALFIKWFPER